MIQQTPSQQIHQVHPVQMATHSQQIAKDSIQFIFQSFQNHLNVNQLTQYLPQFNTFQVHSLNQECVSYFHLFPDKNSKTAKMNEDFMPLTNITDSLITFHIKLQQTQISKLSKSKQTDGIKNPSFQRDDQFNSTQKFFHPMEDSNTLNYSMSKSMRQQISNTQKLQNMNSSSIIQTSDQIKIKQFKEQTSKKPTEESSLELNKKQLNSSDLLPLNLKSDPVDPVLENELEHIKKHLYTMRRYRKIGIEQERQRLDNMAKKKSYLFFNKNSEHTYEYDGTVLELNKLKDTKQLVQQIRPTLLRNGSQRSSLKSKAMSKKSSVASTSLECTQNNSFIVGNGQKIQESNPERQLTSQQQAQKASFSNGNKRQVSHLPFIALKDNTKVLFYVKKIIENKKQLSGSMTLRSSLNRSKVTQFSSDSHKFKSFAQLEQQKRLQKTRQKVLELTESQSNEMFVDILPPTLNLNPNSEPLRKQSKMMQKYLKKLTQERSRIEKFIENDGKKSTNFQQLRVPQKYPIQRYYEYDYDEDKHNYEYEITSKLSSSKRGSINESQYN